MKKYLTCTFDDFLDLHYEIERLLELLTETASDLVFHLISQKNPAMPTTYRAAFLEAGEQKIISVSLADSLSKAAGMRNILAHEYENLDYKIIYQSIPIAIQTFQSLAQELQPYLHRKND